jgi:TetR/AcrR family transcriptional repressor of mexJK operon
MTLRPSSIAKREAILEAAEHAFLFAGYDAVTMDDIADRAGVSKQTAYAHFGSKDSLFVELVTSMTRAAGDPVLANPPAIERPEDVGPTLERLLDRQLSIVLTPRLLRLRRLVIGEVARFPALARALAEEGPHRAIRGLAALLEELHRSGLLAIPDAPTAAAQLNWLVMGGPLNDAMLLGDRAVLSTRKRKAHVHAAVATFVAAYGCGTPHTPTSTGS